MASTRDFIKQKLLTRKEDNSFRSLTPELNLIDFASNDYLGLARSEELFESIQRKAESLPHRNGSTGSRLLSGNSTYTQSVEQKLADIFKSEAALIFNSGYAANQAVLSSLPQRGDTILYDELAHACIRDGARLSFANQHSFKHNDLSDLEKKLKQTTGNIFIVAESIYSMDGDECPLEGLVALAKQYNAFLMLDEAHSTGLFGINGSGFAVDKNLHDKVDLKVYTFGKAMGIHGACVAGSRDLIDYIINFARQFIFTTALSPHSIAAIDCSFALVSASPKLQQVLKDKIELFTSLTSLHLRNMVKSNSQIQGIIIPGNNAIKQVANQLQAKGFDVRAILSPTVPVGSERLRICLHTFNSDVEIMALVTALKSLA